MTTATVPRPSAPAADPTDPEVAALIRDRLEARRRDLEGSLKSYQQWVEDAKKRLEEVDQAVTAEVATTMGCRRALEAAGFRVEHVWGLVHVVHTTEDKLTDVYRVVGRLDGKSVEKDIVDAKKKLLSVTLKAAACPNIRVVYEKKLKKTDRCHIQKVREKATTRTVLVCER